MRLWSAPTGDVVREVHGHTDSVWSIDASPDEGRLATVGDDFRLRLWNASTLQQLLDVEIGLGVRAVAWEGRGRYVVAAPPPGDNEGVIGIWDVAQGTCTRRLIGHDNWVMQLAFSVDGQTLVSTDANGSARVWDFDSGTCRFELQSPTGSAAIHIAIEDQGKQLFLGHRDGRVTVWHLATGDLLHEWSAFGDSLSGLELTPGGDRLLVTSQSDARLKVWDTGLQAAVATLDLGDGYLAAFRLSPDGRWFATMGSDGVVHVRQLMRTPSARGDGPTVMRR